EHTDRVDPVGRVRRGAGDAVDEHASADAADDVVGGISLVQPHRGLAGDGVQVDGVHIAGGVDQHAAGDDVDRGLADGAGRGDLAGDAVGVERPLQVADLDIAGDRVDGEVA